MLSLPGEDRIVTENSLGYLHPVLVDGHDLRYYFKNKNISSLTQTSAEYSFEEAFLLVPDFFKFITYGYNAETKKVEIDEHDTESASGSFEHIFEKVVLNLTKTGGPITMLSPGSTHPCEGGEDGVAAATSENCMTPIRTEDGNFVVMYGKNTSKGYRTESPNYNLCLNNYFIPLLSADMSIWWYKIPNFKLTGYPAEVVQDRWKNDLHARENAEKVLSIWHQDQVAFEQAVVDFPALEEKFYVGVYQRSYFCDELQMRFINVARIANDASLSVNSRIQDLSTVHYNVLRPNFPEIMLINQ
jgi:hypothetical protein